MLAAVKPHLFIGCHIEYGHVYDNHILSLALYLFSLTMKSIKLKNQWWCQNYNIINARWGCLSRKNHGKNIAPPKQWLFKVHYQFEHITNTLRSRNVWTPYSQMHQKPSTLQFSCDTIYFVSDTKPHHCIYTLKWKLCK